MAHLSMPSESRRAIIYCRISRDREGAGLGVERQRQDCEELAAKHGWTVIAVLIDNDLSAYSGKPRPGYREVLGYLRDGRADAVMCWHTDRLHRSPAELEEYITVCEAADAPTLTVKAGPLDLTTPSGRLVARQLGAVARYEVEHMAERRQRAKLQKVADGRWLGGRRPFGYEADGVTVRPEEAALIAAATDGVLVGVSLTQLARDWNAAGIATSGGKRWRAEEVRRTLLRARNAGIMVHRGEEVGSAEWPAVVAEDRWRAVVAILTDPSRRTTPGPERRWLGSGLYLCGFPVSEGQECGLVAKMGTAGNGPKLGRSTPAYRCSGPARHVVRDAGNVDGYVEDAIVTWLSRPIAAEILAPPKRGENSMELHMRALTLKTRIAEAGDMWEAGEITRAEYVKRKGRIQERLDQLNEQIAASVTVSAFAGLLDADDVGAVWDGLPLSRRRAVLEELVTVTILPAPRGRPRGWQPGDPYFSPDHVRLEWRHA